MRCDIGIAGCLGVEGGQGWLGVLQWSPVLWGPKTNGGEVRCWDQVGRCKRGGKRSCGRRGRGWRVRGGGYRRRSAGIRRRLRGVMSSSIICWRGGRRCGVRWRGWWRRRAFGGGRRGRNGVGASWPAGGIGMCGAGMGRLEGNAIGAAALAAGLGNGRRSLGDGRCGGLCDGGRFDAGTRLPLLGDG